MTIDGSPFWIAAMGLIAICWLVVLASWTMFSDRPKSTAWKVFSGAVVVIGLAVIVVAVQG